MKLETEVGNISRQEAVSMVGGLHLVVLTVYALICCYALSKFQKVFFLTKISQLFVVQVPPLFLDVRSDQFVLDSKQLMMHSDSFHCLSSFL